MKLFRKECMGVGEENKLIIKMTTGSDNTSPVSKRIVEMSTIQSAI